MTIPNLNFILEKKHLLAPGRDYLISLKNGQSVLDICPRYMSFDDSEVLTNRLMIAGKKCEIIQHHYENPLPRFFGEEVLYIEWMNEI